MNSALYLFVLLLATFVLCQSNFIANTGSGCVTADIGECIVCESNGIQYSVKANSFSFGALHYDIFSDPLCETVAKSHSEKSSQCSRLPECGMAANGILLFHVMSEEPLSTTCMDKGAGIISMNATSALAYGTFDLLVFTAGRDSLRYLSSNNNTFSTTLGDCPYNNWCTFGSLSVLMQEMPFGPAFAAAAEEISKALRGLTDANDPMVKIMLETIGYQIATTEQNVFILEPNGLSLPASALPTAIVRFPFGYTMTDMSLEGDSTEPILAAEVEWTGLSKYEEIDCNVKGETSFQDVKIECSPSFPFEVTSAGKGMASYDDIFVDMGEGAEWEDQPSFALFE